MSKQYGLILTGKNEKKPTPIFQASKNVFGDESDSDEESGTRKPLLRPASDVKRQVKVAQEKALAEDPTVFQYDELYDDMEHKKKAEKTASKEDKKPKYIEKLIESASKRKREHERRLERQVQKEREKEGSEFADKESFVTSAYKKKLEELRAEEEREKREEYLENIGDVTKQKDLGGFYRHLYEQKLGAEPKIKGEIEHSAKKESKDAFIIEEEKTEIIKVKQSTHEMKAPGSPNVKKNRNYRKRKISSEMAATELSEGEIVSDDEVKVPTLEDIRATKKARSSVVPNIDADSDFSVDSSDSEGESNKKVTKGIKSQKNKSISDKEIPQDKTKEQFKTPLDVDKAPSDNKADKELSSQTPSKENQQPSSPIKPKVNIWEKRTVGVVFEEALKRYYERKAARSH